MFPASECIFHGNSLEFHMNNFDDLLIYLNAKVSQLLIKCYFHRFEINIWFHNIVINKSNNLPSNQHGNQTSETYDCRSSTRNVRQPKFEKSQSYNTYILSSHNVTPPYILFGKGVKPLSCKRRRTDKPEQVILCIW